MKRFLRHLHPRRPLFWVMAAATIGIVIWALWPRALAAMNVIGFAAG